MSATFQSRDPATGEVIWQGKVAGSEEVAAAVSAAARAFEPWRKTPLVERVGIVERYRAVVEAHREDFARLIARETGKVLWDTRGEVQAVIGKVAISLDAYRARTGESRQESAGGSAMLMHKPHGVAAVFGPYNFPAHLPNGHIVPTLIAGNTVVFKPSDYTPMVAETMESYWREAGLPDGVLSVVQGGRDTGVALAGDARISALYFTGSAEVGALLHKQFGGRPEIILALEMGGNNPLIVHEVGDIQAAALLAVQSSFISTGQRCTCARRLIVPRGAEGDAFLEALVAMTKRLRIGPWDASPEPFMGPLISAREAEKLLEAQGALIKGGARALLLMQARAENTAFVTPAILDVTAVKDRPDREHFGPFLQVIRVSDFADAMREANNTRYGLAAGLISDNAALYARFAEDIRAGVIAWNRPTTGASSALPFGGVGISGNHRPSAYYAADYCAYPVSSQEAKAVAMPATLPPGIAI